jgi:magnesium transporter
MLTAYPAASNNASDTASPTPRPSSWVDLLDPTDAEKASVEGKYGFKLPSRRELSEIESSSRIYEANGVLYLSMPIVAYAGALDQAPSPLGFVLCKDVLVTIRYTPLRSFDAVAAKFSKNGAPATGVEAFTAIVDEMVDLLADLLEAIGVELDDVSRDIFPRRGPRRGKGRRKLSQSNDALRGVLIDVGNVGESASRIRDILLGLQRIVPFVAGPGRAWVPQEAQDHLKTAQTDIVSLADYETHLSNKVQFLLDAVLGLINTKQNDIFTVLTVVSVVGIPPTLVASIYGMNFKNMPELSWAWGYQWGLFLIALSTIVPILWFKWRGWL